MALISISEGEKLQRDPETVEIYRANFSELLPVSALN